MAAATAVSRLRLVKLLVGGTVEQAGATDDVIGVADNDVPQAVRHEGERCLLIRCSGHKQLRFTASAAIAVGAKLEKAADGKVATLNTGQAIGYVNITPNIDGDGDVLTAVPVI